MNDAEIEKLLISVIDNHLKDTNNSLSFTSEFSISWENNTWALDKKAADPLSLILVAQNSERYLNRDDNVITSTLSKVLDKKPWFIRSFQCGWSGLSNSSMSIGGFVLGDKLRRLYLKDKK